MRRIDRIKLNFIRNWNFPGKERLSHRFKPSPQLKSEVQDGITWLNTEDIAIYTTADSYIEWTILSTGTYEDEIGKLIKISLNHGDNALDIGANIGLQSLRMSRSVSPTGKVYAFEPIEYLQQKFKRNIGLNKASNVELLPFALSDEASETDFKIDKRAWNQGTFSLLSNAGTDLQHVLIKVGDDVPEIQMLSQLALVKIDVEGFEYQVLKGLKKTLTRHKPRLIFEYDHNYWVATGQDISDCFSFLQLLGYTVYQINALSCKLVTDSSQIQGGNLFCVPSSI